MVARWILVWDGEERLSPYRCVPLTARTSSRRPSGNPRPRITSYNVCYTKLLRSCPTSKLIRGAGANSSHWPKAGRFESRGSTPQTLDLLLACGPIRFAHLALQRLARRAARKILHDDDVRNALIPGGHAFVDPVITSYSIHYTKLYEAHAVAQCSSHAARSMSR